MHLPLLIASALVLQPAPKLDVEVTFAKSALAQPFSGRVFVVATRSANSDAPRGISWFDPQPFFALDVIKWNPDTPLQFRPTLGYPKTWDELAKEKWHLQAVIDRGLDGQSCTS